MKTSRAALALYEGQELTISYISDQIIVYKKDGTLIDTPLIDEAETLIAAAVERITAEKEEEKTTDRARVAASFGASLAIKLLPDSLYEIASPVSMGMNGMYFVGTITDSQLASDIAALSDGNGNGGNHNGR